MGARAVTIAASALLTTSALGQSLAGSYAVLLASWTLGDRLPLLVASGAATLALAVVLLIPVVASSALPVIVFLVIRARLWAVVSTISNPLSAHAAALAGVGTGFGLGLMNLCWAAGNLGGRRGARRCRRRQPRLRTAPHRHRDRHRRPAHAPAPLHHSVPVTLSGDPFE